MPPALRTLVVAPDPRTLRALSRLLSCEPRLALCGFLHDARTAAEIARSLRAHLAVLDARVADHDAAKWPATTRRIVLYDGAAQTPPRPGELRLPTTRLAAELPQALAALFPGSRPAGARRR